MEKKREGISFEKHFYPRKGLYLNNCSMKATTVVSTMIAQFSDTNYVSKFLLMTQMTPKNINHIALQHQQSMSLPILGTTAINERHYDYYVERKKTDYIRKW